MNWIQVIKDTANHPTRGRYNDWKQQLAEEGKNQCVYCAIHENAMGGIRNFHVEHYRPKSKFEELVNDYGNLFYSCPICNTFKSNDWPNEPVHDNAVASYPNPSTVDYNCLFEIDLEHGAVNGTTVATAYMQEKLYLNRPQLITERRIAYILSKTRYELAEIKQLLNTIQDNALYRNLSEELMDLWVRLDEMKDKLRVIPHYQLSDVRR